MTAIREPGKLNQNTFLIDAVHEGIQRGFAVYLLKSNEKGGKSCLIDAGTKSSAPVIYEKLKECGAWPPDMIIITHSHFDHTQGTEFLRSMAAESGATIEVLAHKSALPYLEDQSFNICFGTEAAPYLNISGAKPLRDGDRIDLGSDLTLRILHTPGHMVDHICILDETNKNIFVGDCIGMKFLDGLMICNANSPYWEEDAFVETIQKLKGVDFTSLSLAHFGCLTGAEAKGILDESLAMYRQWMQIFADNRDRIHDADHLTHLMWERLYAHIPPELRELMHPHVMACVAIAANAYLRRST